MRILTLISIAVICAETCGSSTNANTCADQLIAYCATDGRFVLVPESPERAVIAEIDDLELRGGFEKSGTGIRFSFNRQDHAVFSFQAKDAVSESVWLAIEEESHSIAIQYSTGGAIGNFRVRAFRIHDNEVTDVSRATEAAASDFKSRHYCQARGNSLHVLKWINGDLLLMPEVYPTGDCKELGYVEGYRVSVPDGKIKEHLSLDQLKHYAGVCLQNDDRR